MLCLSRKKDQRIVFPDLGISVCVIAIRGDKVRLGVEAPREIKVHREEVQERITEQDRQQVQQKQEEIPDAKAEDHVPEVPEPRRSA